MENLRRRVLVIDPDPSIRALLAAVVRRHGFEADTTGDQAEARQRARSCEYTAVILEPRMRGGDALLRDLPRDKVIVATTSAGIAAQRAGVAAVLRKPFLLAELSAAIDVCAARTADRAPAAAAQASR